MLRILFFSVTLGALTLVLFRHTSTTHDPHCCPSSMTSDPLSWSSAFASWHSRAQAAPHPDLSTFTPSRDTLSLVVLLNAPVENEGFTLALFSEPREDGTGHDVFAVDTLGHTLFIAEKDAFGIFELARKAVFLPATETFRNTWVVTHPITSQPIHRFFIFPAIPGDRDDPHEISVQGFSKETRKLQRPVEGNVELPQVLWELVGLVLEAREGAGHEENRHDISLDRVREVVASLF